MIRILAIVFAFCAMAAAVRAEAPVCTGTDLLAQLKSSDPAIYEKVMTEARATPNGEALFWKIERDGTKPSFLLGTAHVTDPRVTELSPAASEALNAAAMVALELAELGDQQRLSLAMMKNAPLMVLPGGQSLWDLVPDADEAAVRDDLALQPGVRPGERLLQVVAQSGEGGGVAPRGVLVRDGLET